MSLELINRSPDLLKLRNSGYEIEVKGAFLLIKNVPYVNQKSEIARGTLVSDLDLNVNVTIKPKNHVIHFQGDHPCNKDGTIIQQIQYMSAPNRRLADGIITDHSFSNKPPQGYSNYFEKIERYVEIISAPAISLDDSVTAKTFNVVVSHDQVSPFEYEDTNSSRSEITCISEKLKDQKIGIVGLGGTGAYTLDLVSKTPVKEIHLFDGDIFLQHNAFRSPGAADIEELHKKMKKVDFHQQRYKKMHKNIFVHPHYVDHDNLEKLRDLTFVFICMDSGPSKKDIIQFLQANSIPFIDTGIGINIVQNQLIGSLRVTTSTEIQKDHIDQHISYDSAGDDLYSSNIQIAELNMLNATLAVLKWKKLFGIYQDIEKEHQSIYSLNMNSIVNEEKSA